MAFGLISSTNGCICHRGTHWITKEGNAKIDSSDLRED